MEARKIMKICHISDTHGAKYHSKLVIPECDVLLHTGDLGYWRTGLMELTEFLIWFEKQPARCKIFIAGNHDVVLDHKWYNAQYKQNPVMGAMAKQQYDDAKELIKNYDVVYLNDSSYTFEGVKFYGSPYTPSFHREHWAFNADRGDEIKKIWSKIPNDVNVLLTHGPVYDILDHVEDRFREQQGEDMHVGCKDLYYTIKQHLFKLKLHCSGHIHGNVGIVNRAISNTRHLLFSNQAVVTNDGEQLVFNPLIINL